MPILRKREYGNDIPESPSFHDSLVVDFFKFNLGKINFG
jgi:hypothetical protein